MASLPERYPSSEPVSAVARVATGAARREPMSARLWGLDFAKLLPWTFDDVRVCTEPLEDVLPDVARIFGESFEAGEQWLHEPMTEAKRRFGEEMDVFVFRRGEAIVGVLIGHPTDWSTYYWRSAAFLPEYRGQHLLSRTVERAFALLRDAGVKRTEFETSAANHVMVRHFSAHGFVVTSTLTSERWGVMLRFTKFLDDEAARIYARQFLNGPLNPPKNERSTP